jgi:protein gp37
MEIQLSSATGIEWTDVTWNPVAGCSVATAGCTNCYAMRMAARLESMSVAKYDGLTRKSGKRYVWSGKVTLDWLALDIPSRWKKPRRVFVNSMSDLFHPEVTDEFIVAVWAAMRRSPQHTYQILTKRPERMRSLTEKEAIPLLRNVWLGTSVEGNSVVHRLNDLRRTAAVVRFVSFEPLIGSVKDANLAEIDWAIVGGESGPNARAMDSSWVGEIAHLCRESRTAFFFKPWGGEIRKRQAEPTLAELGTICLRPGCERRFL